MFVAVDHHFDLETPKLTVPTEFKVKKISVEIVCISFSVQFQIFFLCSQQFTQNVVGSFPLSLKKLKKLKQHPGTCVLQLVFQVEFLALKIQIFLTFFSV